MKSPIRLITVCIFTVSLSGWLSLVYASPSPVSPSDNSQASISFQDKPYPSRSTVASGLLKWPKGILIYPENNNPNETNEVFLLQDNLISPLELYTLHHHLGLQYFSRSKYNQAKKEYLKALRFKPGTPAVYNNLGLIYFNSKHYKKAERAYRKALKLDPGHAPALAKLALSLAAQKKYSLAERQFKQAVRAEPSNAEHHLNLGHFYYYLKKNYREAKNSYQKALKLNSHLIKAKNNLRDINRKFRKWDNQKDNFESSWGNDFDYDGPNNRNPSKSLPGYPEDADIAGTWDEESAQHPLF